MYKARFIWRILIVFSVLVWLQPEKSVLGDDGTVDLEKWSFVSDGAYSLKKGWRVYRDKLIDPSAFVEGTCDVSPAMGDIQGEDITAPDVWGPTFTGHISSGHGKATYCIGLKLPADSEFYGIELGTLRSISRVYMLFKDEAGGAVNILAYKNGNPDLNTRQVIHKPDVPNIKLPYDRRDIVLIIQVSNTIHKQGGMVEVPTVDVLWRLDASANRSTAWPTALIIVLLLVSVSAIIVGQRFETAHGHNVFAFLTFASAIRVLFVSDLVWDYFPAFSLSRKYDFEYMSLFLIGAAYYAFITFLFRGKVVKFEWGIYGLCGVMVLYCLFLAPFLPPGSITLIREASQIFWGFIALFVGYLVIRVFWQDPDKSKQALFVIGAGFLTVVYDSLSVAGVIEYSLEWSQAIILLVTMMHARAFVINSWRIERERDELTKRLTEANIDLKKRAMDLDLALVRAEEASKAKSNFLATVSHELRTPLNAIIGFSELIKRELFGPIGDSKYKDYASDIYDSGSHLLSLVDDILDLSRIEADMDPMHEQVLNLPDVVNGAFRLLRTHAKKAEVKCSFVAETGLPELFADERKLKQIFINLVGNAIKFNVKGGSVTVKVRADDKGMSVKIIDTGIGIKQQDISLVQTRFGQVEDQLRRKYSGVGIGLPLSIELARQHEATLDIESELGIGTTITLQFPVDRCREKPIE